MVSGDASIPDPSTKGNYCPSNNRMHAIHGTYSTVLRGYKIQTLNNVVILGCDYNTQYGGATANNDFGDSYYTTFGSVCNSNISSVYRSYIIATKDSSLKDIFNIYTGSLRNSNINSLYNGSISHVCQNNNIFLLFLFQYTKS